MPESTDQSNSHERALKRLYKLREELIDLIAKVKHLPFPEALETSYILLKYLDQLEDLIKKFSPENAEEETAGPAPAVQDLLSRLEIKVEQGSPEKALEHVTVPAPQDVENPSKKDKQD